MLLLLNVEIMNVGGGDGGSGGVCHPTNVLQILIKCLAYNTHTHTRTVWDLKAHIWSTQLQAFNCCYEHILSKFRPNTIDLLYMYKCVCVYLFLLNIPTNTIIVSAPASVAPHSHPTKPSHQYYVRTLIISWIFSTWRILIYFCGEFDLYAR